MKTFVKNYIRKGKQVAGLQIVKITCKLEDLQKLPTNMVALVMSPSKSQK